MQDLALLNLLQLVSPALPVGAYSYSEGLEALVEQTAIYNRNSLENWLTQELKTGSIRVEVAVLLRTYRCLMQSDLAGVQQWNQWLSATRETHELRRQNWQMGQSLSRLLADLIPSVQPDLDAIGSPCNFAIAFALAAYHRQISVKTALIGYLYSWTTNLISAGVRLIPLGQTEGQQIQLALHPILLTTAAEIPLLGDEDLGGCNWGLSLASMAHQTQYTRLFRS